MEVILLIPQGDLLMSKICALIPTHNHFLAIPAIIDRLRSVGLSVYIVDDGSSPEIQNALQKLVADDVHVLTLPKNRGKGGAILEGLRWINSFAYTHALQVDADGQHCLDTLETFLEVSQMNPQALISGQPLYDGTVPKIRQFGRWFTHVWVWIETLSLRITDSMCGFRVYPVQKSLDIMETKNIGLHMEFDTGIMVHLFWSGTPVIMLPLKVTYPEGNSSNFKMLKDNWRITKMHTRLFFTMLMNLPTILRNRPDYGALKLPQEAVYWASMEERGSLMGLFFLAGCYRLLGKRFCTALGTPVVLFHYMRGTVQRQASLAYLKRVFQVLHPGKVPEFKDCFRHYMSFFEMALDKVAAWIGHMKFDQVEYQGELNLEHIMASDKGGMILVSHLGNMEFCRAAARGSHKFRLHVLLHSKNSERFNRMLRAFNPLSKVNIIEVTDIGPDTILYLKELISQGDWIIIAGDRVPVKGTGRVSLAPFLGKDAPFSQGPYILASLLDCPVYTAIAIREGKKFKVFVDLFAEKVILNRSSRMTDIQGYAHQFSAHLEKYVLLYPYQWFNFFDFWNENPHMNEEDK